VLVAVPHVHSEARREPESADLSLSDLNSARCNLPVTISNEARNVATPP
jgi:hypothetical protein